MTDETIISVDFGKEDREHVRRLNRLMGLSEEYDAEVLKYPIRYIKEAYRRLAKAGEAIKQAQDAARRSIDLGPWSAVNAPAAPKPMSILNIEADEYYRLKRAEAALMALDPNFATSSSPLEKPLTQPLDETPK